MSKICIGIVIKPHGVHGEFKCSSSFEYKSKAFKKGNEIILNIDGKSYNHIIEHYNYSTGKKYDICKLNNINTIDDVINIKNAKLLIESDNLNLNIIFNEQLIGLDVYLNDKKIGYVDDVSPKPNVLLIIKTNDNKTIYIPRQDEFISNINLDIMQIKLTDKAKELI